MSYDKSEFPNQNKLISLACRLVWNLRSKSTTQSLIIRVWGFWTSREEVAECVTSMLWNLDRDEIFLREAKITERSKKPNSNHVYVVVSLTAQIHHHTMAWWKGWWSKLFFSWWSQLASSTIYLPTFLPNASFIYFRLRVLLVTRAASHLIDQSCEKKS